MPSPPVQRREIFGWACYDFANSAYTTVIVTVVFSLYFVEVIHGGQPGGYGLWSTMLAVSQAVVIALSPVLGALADVTGRKKAFLAVTALACSAATAALWFTGPGTVALAFFLIVAGNIAFSLGENFCSSFLPEISTPENVGRISAWGWGFGYCGGLLSLLFALGLVHTFPDHGARASFLMTGVFFIVASLPTFLLLRERATPQPGAAGHAVRAALTRLWASFHEIRQHRELAVFFIAFFLFISGLSAVFAFAAIVAGQQFDFSQKEIIGLFAALQITATLGALGFGRLQDRYGARPVLVLSLLGWIVVSGAVAWATGKPAFWAIGCLAGLVMGSTQSASRALVSLLTPPGRSGEIFGFWGLFGKLAAIVGPLVYGWAAEAFSLATASLINGAFFIAGLAVLLLMPIPTPRPIAPH
jgi:UMF1 family MFS transporter